MTTRGTTALLVAAALVGGCDTGTETETPTMFDVTVANVAGMYAFPASGAFTTPTGGSSPAPLGPGESYEVTVPGLPGTYLSFVTMFVQSNDLFYAPGEAGIALFDQSGNPVSGDVTSQVMLWDAGTETDQALGEGSDQAPRQSGPDTGDADADDSVRLASNSYSSLPAVSDVIKVTLTPDAGSNTFTLTIENVSTSSTLSTSGGSVAVPLSPGVWVTHSSNAPLFTVGMTASAGLESIAEDGDPTTAAQSLADMTGTTTPLAPGAYAVLMGGTPMYSMGGAASAGLESLAEDGDPSGLASELMGASMVASSGAFATPVGASEPGPLLPGNQYSFTIEAVPGDRLQLATMYVQSNDLFYGFDPGGIALFNGDTPVSGDVTEELGLYDAGTEVNQWPGFGPDQAPRQAGPDTGADENGTVGAVDDAYDYGEVADVIQVNITPRNP